MQWGLRRTVVLKCWTMVATSVLTSSGIPHVVARFVRGFALGSALLGLVALWLFRALDLHQFAPIEHDGMFLRGSVTKIHLLLLAHRPHVSDDPFREVRLMSTIALKGRGENFFGHGALHWDYRRPFTNQTA
jgi:hypothetical protein